MQTIKKVFFFFTLTALFVSCKKDELLNSSLEKVNYEKERFFNLPANATERTKKIAKQIKHDDEKNNFVKSLIEKYGFPKWDKLVESYVYDNSSRTTTPDTVYTLIPFLNSNNILSSILNVADVSDSLKFKLLTKQNIIGFINSSDSSKIKKNIQNAKILAAFEKSINGKDSLLLNNCKLPKFKNCSFSFTNSNSGRTADIIFVSITTCGYVWIPNGFLTGVEPGGSANYGSWEYECNTTSAWFQTINSSLNSEGSSSYDPNWWLINVSSGGGSGTGPNNPPNNPIPMTEQQKSDYLVTQLNLNPTQLFYLSITPNAINTIFNYIYDDNTVERRNIAVWAIDYFSQHPNVNMEIFTNQFLGKSEGYEGEYDTYWDNPNLTFPPQNLPIWDDFNAAFPRDTDTLYDSPEKMYNSIGGSVYTNGYTGPESNTCAVRLSKALNYSGVTIPNIPGQTFKGDDDKYYFLAAFKINIWMRKTFGTNPSTSSTPLNLNHHSYTQAQAGVNGENLPGLLSGKKGIYSIYSSDFSWASGHADLLNPDSTCGNECHFADAPIARLDIWILN